MFQVTVANKIIFIYTVQKPATKPHSELIVYEE